MLRIFRTACCLAIVSPFFSGQNFASAPVKRIYVEPFATQAASDKLRNDLIAELRKLSTISIVPAESEADEILGGGGEIWIKGYRSLNPRSVRYPPSGTPVYAGYLSVELRDRQGQTLWSDLVTPSAGAEDVSKDLARRIAKHVSDAVVKTPFTEYPRSLPQPSVVLKGAGATFPYPVYAKWITNYRRENPAVEIVYEAIGSEAGIRKLLAGSVDFAASDDPRAVTELSGESANYIFFPSVVGAVVPIVNLPGVIGDVQFTPEALAGIYLGTIKKWSDPVLKQANRGLNLPDLNIVVVHRSDGSGTSYAWSDFLSRSSAEWKTRVGSGLAPKWPTGRSATGNDGVAKLVKELGGAVGYVEFIYALDNHLNYGKVRNRHGEFVAASLESIAAAVHSADIRDDLKISIADTPAPGAYPIATFTWLVVPAHVANESIRTGIEGFLKWMLDPGQAQAAALGYLALPKEVVRREEAAIAKIH